MAAVVFDTNEIQRDWLCAGLLFELVRIQPFSPPLSFYVPVVVMEELVANHAREAEAAAAQVDTAGRKLARLGMRRGTAPVQTFDYRSYLNERFDEVLGITVLEWPAVSHAEIAARAVARRPPFDNRGAGYRDALVWADVVGLAAAGKASPWFLMTGPSESTRR